MTVTIEFHENIKDETIASYSQKWLDSFIQPTETGRHFVNTYYNDAVRGQYKQYSNVNSASTGDNTGIILSGEINFLLCHMTHYGKIESLEFGAGGVTQHEGNENVLTKQLVEPQLKINELNIVAEYDYLKSTTENQQNIIHQFISSLKNKNGTTDEILLEALAAQGIDINIPLKDMAIASQFDAIADVPVIDTVGATDGSDSLLAA
ncbi:hemophore [Yersinia aldovae ATCC 35236]|uniref:Hemophore n=1 Tax=Yersinia aldovae TaxID=29483 RepID=A0A0T9ULQ1_YERAL|nr:heme acquisition protein HasA [Yersinia aldovae]EEP94206.1 hemophore [Yersinia aldovae ATCC 35236]CNL51614.1 hemophore [Yersinia aldovae]